MSLTQRGAHWLLHRARPHWVRNALSLALFEVESFAPPRVLDTLPGKRVLVLAPHCDDESIACGGTLAGVRDRGADVRVTFLTDGSLGSRAVRDLPDSDPRKPALREQVRATREREARAALGVLGVPLHDFLGVPDGALSAGYPGLAGRLSAIVGEFQPDLILLPLPTDRHRDHAATARCLLAALDRTDYGATRHAQWAGYEVWSTGYPNVIVDISAFEAVKRAAIRAYASQTSELDLEGGALALNRFRAVSGLLDPGYAEGFYLGPLSLLGRLCRRLDL